MKTIDLRAALAAMPPDKLAQLQAQAPAATSGRVLSATIKWPEKEDDNDAE